MKLHHIFLALGIASGLIACSSDSSSEATEEVTVNTQGQSPGNAGVPDDRPLDNDRLNLVGLIKIEPNSSDADFSRAVFGRLDTALTVSAMEQFYYPDSDDCAFSLSAGSPEISGPQFVVLDQFPAKISAGETIILSSDAGTYATLERKIDESGPSYETNVRLSGSAPGGLFADIPGDEFPAFTNIRLGDVPELQVITPADGQSITANTRFTWIANDVPESVFELYMAGATGVGDEVILVSCAIVDDGSFSFPENVRRAIGENYSEHWSSFLRVVYRKTQSDNAIVFVANSVKSQ